MNDFITFSPKLYSALPSSTLTVNKADIVKIQSFEDGSASIYIRGEHMSLSLHPDDVERLRMELTGLPPQDPVSIKARAENIDALFRRQVEANKRHVANSNPDQTEP